MIHCVRGYPTITAKQVWHHFGEHGVMFDWKGPQPSDDQLYDPNAPPAFNAFMSCIEILHTNEGLIFITMKKKQERANVEAMDYMGRLFDNGDAVHDGVLVYSYHHFEDDGEIRTVDCLELSGKLTKKYFASEVLSPTGFRAEKYDTDKCWAEGSYVCPD